LGVASHDDRSVHIHADRLDRNEGAGGGTGELDQFLRHMGSRLNRWVINETTAPADLKVSWANHKSSSLQKLEEGPEKAKRIEMIMVHLARQTSLEFRPQRRTMEMWFILKDE
jgi:hypothetical protein